MRAQNRVPGWISGVVLQSSRALGELHPGQIGLERSTRGGGVVRRERWGGGARGGAGEGTGEEHRCTIGAPRIGGKLNSMAGTARSGATAIFSTLIASRNRLGE